MASCLLLQCNVVDILALNVMIIWILNNSQWEMNKRFKRRLFLNQLARSLTVPWITHYQSKQATVRSSAACNLGRRISYCYWTEAWRGGYKTTMLPVRQEGQINTVQMPHMLQTIVCLTIRLLQTNVIEANNTKTNWLTITVYFIVLWEIFSRKVM